MRQLLWGALARLHTIISPVVYWGVDTIARLGARSATATQSSYHGFKTIELVPEQNKALYRDRVHGAIDLLNTHAPTHARWLRKHFKFVGIYRSPVAGPIVSWPRARSICLRPRVVYMLSEGELAVELGVIAAHARAGYDSRRTTPATESRARHRGLHERLWLAERLPDATRIADVCRARLEAEQEATSPRPDVHPAADA